MENKVWVMSGRSTKGEDRGNAFAQFYRWVLGHGYERNIGGPERTIRYTLGALFGLVGIGIIAFPVISDALTNAVLAAALIAGGLYLIYEAQVQYCPLNHTLERSTYSAD